MMLIVVSVEYFCTSIRNFWNLRAYTHTQPNKHAQTFEFTSTWLSNARAPFREMELLLRSTEVQ